MNDHLVICFPGLSSPYSQNHKDAYALVKNTAHERGIDFKQICYPGQLNESGESEGQFSSYNAIDFCVDYIENQKITAYKSVMFFGISTGCQVSIGVYEKLQSPNIKELKIWGPIPHWLNWDFFIRDPHEGTDTEMIDKKEHYNQLVPIEVSLRRLEIEVSVGIGSKDKWLSRSFLDYLGDRNKNKSNIKYNFIDKCDHNVNMGNSHGYKQYLEFVFGSIK